MIATSLEIQDQLRVGSRSERPVLFRAKRSAIGTLTCLALWGTTLPGCLSLSPAGALTKKLLPPGYEHVETEPVKPNTKRLPSKSATSTDSQAAHRVDKPIGPAGNAIQSEVTQVSNTQDARGTAKSKTTRAQNESPAPVEPDVSAPGATDPAQSGDTGKATVTLPAESDVSAATLLPENPQDAATADPSLQQVTLEQAVTECQNSFTLHAAAERMNQANADLTTASLLPNPSVSAITSMQPFPGRPFTVDKTGGPPQYDLWTTYPMDWLVFGKRNAAMYTASMGTEVANFEFQEVVRQRVLQTRLAFFEVLEARELRKLALQDKANLKQVEEITVKQIDLGGAGTVELDRVRLALFNSERELQTRETTHKNAKSVLRALMGRTEADPDFDVSGSLEITNPLDPIQADFILQTAQSNRPDIEAARKQVDWANAALLQEEHKAKPQLSGTVGFTYQQQRKALGMQDAPSIGGGFQMTLPTFDKNQGNITKAQSTYSQAYYNLQARLTALQSEVDQAATAYRAAHQAVTSINVAQATAAKNVRDKVAAAYAAGGRPLIEVLDTERAYRDTIRLLISGRASYWKSLNQLNAVAGTPLLEP